ncbi:MAG: polymer-forming cytoskeletal protein [Dehalococcoidales bacterium]|nr:polymer-forming cytoskeletal protein [Dehalococcoidales bacterium]
MNRANKTESGQVLILVLILLAVGALLIYPMLNLSYSAQKSHQIVEINTLNAYAADSGIEYARYKIYNFPSEIQSAGLDEYLVISGIDVHVIAEFEYAEAAYRITSTASRASRSTTIECMVVIDVGLFGKVVACDGDLNINQCVFINPEYPGESDVFVNGNITISGSSIYPTYIDGDVSASGTVTVGEHSTVTGEINEHEELLAFPPIDPTVHEDKAKATGDIRGSTYLTSGGNYTLGPTFIDGNLTVGQSNKTTTLTLEGTVYVTGNITFVGCNSSNSTTLQGFGDIIAEGNISFGTNNIFELTITDYLPLMMSIYGNISITADVNRRPYVQAIIYAPAPASVISLDWVDAFGSVAARTINLNHSSLEYPAELRGRADLPGSGLDTIIYLFK